MEQPQTYFFMYFSPFPYTPEKKYTVQYTYIICKHITILNSFIVLKKSDTEAAYFRGITKSCLSNFFSLRQKGHAGVECVPDLTWYPHAVVECVPDLT